MEEKVRREREREGRKVEEERQREKSLFNSIKFVYFKR